MSLRQDNVVLSVQINGNEAQNKLNDLKKKAADLSYELSLMKKGTQEFIAKSAELSKVDSEMSALRKQIGLTSLTIKELGAARRQLTAIFNTTLPGSQEFQKYKAELDLVIARQKELRSNTLGLTSAFGSAKQNITSLAAGYIGFQAAFQGITTLVTGVIKLSDQLGDLRRVAGLTANEADSLYKELLKIDTRTSGEGLLNIAIIAGKLGVAKEDIFSFTKAVDKLVVTLGDELGDADQITTQLGKILNVFDGKVTGDNISYLGNAIVDLANKGVATGGFIVDFTQRVSGIAKASNLSLGATVGLAAGLESLGLRSESSSTALQKLLSTIAGNIPKAAKMAGIPLKEFNELFSKTPEEALIKYAEGLTKNKKSFAEITASFKDAGEEGARVVQTLQAIGQQGNYLREQINTGNESIKEQTALNEGFAIKNDNLAGSVEKLGKSFDRLVANNRVASFLRGIVDIIGGAIDGVNDLINSFDTLDEKIKAANADHDKAQADFGLEVAASMANETLEAQQKIADSYKAIYLASQKALSDFLKSGNNDINERNRLLDQQNQDEKIYLATQKELAKTLAAQNKKTDTGIAPDASISATKSKNTGYDRIKKEAADFYKDLQKLKQDAEAVDKSSDEKELIALEQKYNELHAKALNFFKRNAITRKQYNAEELIIVEAFNKELAALQKKQFEAHSADEYAKSLTATKEYFDEQRDLEGQRYAQGLSSKKEYENELKKIDLDEKAQLVTVAQGYTGTVKKAAADLANFRKDLQKSTTQNEIEESELRKKTAEQEALAKAKLNVISAQNEKARVAARKILLQLQFDQDTEGLDRHSELFKQKEAELQAALEQIDTDARQRRIQAADEFAQDLLSITGNLMTALNNLDQRDLQKDKAINDAKKNNYKKQLDAKLLSQKQYDLLTAKADEDLAKKKHETDLKAFKRKQALGIAEALINGALAIEKTYAEMGFPFGTPFAIAMGLVTLAQVAAIATEAPPEAAEGNWFRKGPKHKDPEGGIPVMIERDEAVMKADAMTDSNTYTVTGTPAQITSKLNAIHGGVNWATGATIITPKFRERPPQLNPSLPRIMEQGGIVRPMQLPAGDNGNDELIALLQKNNALLEESNEIARQKSDSLHAVVSIKEYRKKEKEYDQARKASGMNP